MKILSVTQNQSMNRLGIKLPPISESGGLSSKHSNMIVTRLSTQQLIFRNVPPEGHGYTFSDMLGSGRTPKSTRQCTMTLGASTSSEYAKRFKSRSSTKPKVIEFDANSVIVENTRKKRATVGFFPPMKIRVSSRMRSEDYYERESPSSRMQFEPTSYTDIRARSSMSTHSDQSFQPLLTPDSSRSFHENSIIYPSLLSESMDYDDLSYLPPPKRIMPRRQNPWVFRYKVKKSLNELAKIMASKPQPSQDQTVF